jgi:hypothetical protein
MSCPCSHQKPEIITFQYELFLLYLYSQYNRFFKSFVVALLIYGLKIWSFDVHYKQSLLAVTGSNYYTHPVGMRYMTNVHERRSSFKMLLHIMLPHIRNKMKNERET